MRLPSFTKGNLLSNFSTEETLVLNSLLNAVREKSIISTNFALLTYSAKSLGIIIFSPIKFLRINVLILSSSARLEGLNKGV